MKSFFSILFFLMLSGGSIQDHPAAETAVGIGEFYVRQGKFREQRRYLEGVVNDPLPGGQVSDRQTMEMLLFERNIVLAGSSIIFVVSAFVLWGYRMKKRNDSQLQQQLIVEKDKLLAEKDLLMREIHHRVKNNLNIIISLLESQSLFSNNGAARAALQDTQNRVHAVFLLHEKLYGSTTVPELNVHAYVPELINHLYESFDFRNQNIVITHTIEPIYLDAAEVLPLAVILNEAVTNSLKYAFPDGRKGEIHLTLRQTPAGMVQMWIRDNGVGLPADYSPAFGKTLGFTLITGLANQLEGYCKIENEGGVVITIQFRPKERRALAGLVSNIA